MDQQYASPSQKQGTAQVYVGVRQGEKVVRSFYSLSATGEPLDSLAESERRGLPDPVPAYLVGRMAVDLQVGNSGLGQRTMMNAFARALKASKIAGARLLVVDPEGDVVDYYIKKLWFQRLPMRPERLFIQMRAIEKLGLPSVD